MTLRLNGVSIVYTQAELVELGLAVADGRIGYKDIFDWIKRHEDRA